MEKKMKDPMKPIREVWEKHKDYAKNRTPLWHWTEFEYDVFMAIKEAVQIDEENRKGEK